MDGKDNHCSQCIQGQTGKILLAAAEGLAQVITSAGKTWGDCERLTGKFADLFGGRLRALFAQKMLERAKEGADQ